MQGPSAGARLAGPSSARAHRHGAGTHARDPDLLLRSRRRSSTPSARIRLGNLVRADQLFQPLLDEISASMARDPFAADERRPSSRRGTRIPHLHSVAVYMRGGRSGRRLKFGGLESADLGLAELLDIGKAPDSATPARQVGPLYRQEFAIVRPHAERGYRDAALHMPGAFPEIALDVLPPSSLRRSAAPAIPIGSVARLSASMRMGAICDFYDAVTSARAYQEPGPLARRCAGCRAPTGISTRTCGGLSRAVASASIPIRRGSVRLRSEAPWAWVLDKQRPSPHG